MRGQHNKYTTFVVCYVQLIIYARMYKFTLSIAYYRYLYFLGKHSTKSLFWYVAYSRTIDLSMHITLCTVLQAAHSFILIIHCFCTLQLIVLILHCNYLYTTYTIAYCIVI